MYGFSFLRENSGGIGASIHAVLCALVYARHNNLKFGLVKEGLRYPLLNGKIRTDSETEEKNWYSYFQSFPIISEKDAVAIWRDCPQGFNADIPNKYKKPGMKRIEWYSQLLKNEVFVLRKDIEAEVEKRVARSGFNPQTDLVLHIRRTDKIYQYKGSVVESDELPLDEYVLETYRVYVELNKPDARVFLCTDDKKIYGKITEAFGKFNIPVVWDKHESEKELQAMRMAGQLTQSEAHEENLNALKIILIMSRGLYLIGGRMSYIFRIGELLRYPLPTKNIKDSDMFGIAPYAEPDEPFANPFWPKRYAPFVSKKYNQQTDEFWSKISANLNESRIIVLSDFMDEQIAEQVYSDLESYNPKWWVHALRPNEQGDVQNLDVGDPRLPQYIKLVETAADQGQFAYHFKRTLNDHYTTCYCFSCRLRSTFDSYEMRSLLSKLTGRKVIGIGETFASLYERDHFLTIHHDKNKGDYTFVLSLTKDWNPTHGGNLCFWDEAEKTIYKTITPKFNTLVVFKLSPEKQMDHFVSRVCGSGKRISFTGWFNVC